MAGDSWNKSDMRWIIWTFDKELKPDLKTNQLSSQTLSTYLSTIFSECEATIIWVQTLFSSNTLKTNEANFVGSPKGKNCLYIFWKPTASSCPLGQSLMKPLYLKNKTKLEIFKKKKKVLYNLCCRWQGYSHLLASPKGITDSKKELNQKLKCKAISLVHR